MGVFGKKRKSKNKMQTKWDGSRDEEHDDLCLMKGSLQASMSGEPVSVASNKNSKKDSKREKKNEDKNVGDDKSSADVLDANEHTIDMVPELIKHLSHATETSREKPARALRILFALSEHDSHQENRTAMVRAGDGTLVPVLLEFLQRCSRGSSEQYLTLLVLNNISIPAENKRLIALDYGGATIFSRLLCDDPSCHLMAIILVNLTFTDAELRKELVCVHSNLDLIPSLALALTLASMTPDEYESRLPLVTNDAATFHTTIEILAVLMAEEQRVRPSLNADIDDYNKSHKEMLINPTLQLFPETARWSLCALKNLTRPSKDNTAVRALTKTAVVPLVLRFIMVADTTIEDLQQERKKLEQPQDRSSNSSSSNSSCSDTSAKPRDPEERDFRNNPVWETNSIQDAALFVIVNLAAASASRPYLRELDACKQLSNIADFQEKFAINCDLSENEVRQLGFQCLKARMALSYLLGSEGNFGQPRMRSSSAYSNLDDSAMLIGETEVDLLIELLANTLHDRPKNGSGGYSASTFGIKYVLFAIRCLLTHRQNQTRFVDGGNVKLNALLVKTLAIHATKKNTSIDAEAAEHACFSLYLLSNYGFQITFLPASYKGDRDTRHSLIARILIAYSQMENITPAGKHACEQLIMRIRYLIYSGKAGEYANFDRGIKSSDLFLDDETLGALQKVDTDEYRPGAQPRPDIFCRPILRSRKLRKGAAHRAPWDNHECIDTFPSALDAVQQLSYGSTKVRHLDNIDDIVIANNVANSANGEKTESYNYWWSWQDAAGEIQKNLERQRSYDSVSMFSGVSNRINKDDNFFSLFTFPCGREMCVFEKTEPFSG